MVNASGLDTLKVYVTDEGKRKERKWAGKTYIKENENEKENVENEKHNDINEQTYKNLDEL